MVPITELVQINFDLLMVGVSVSGIALLGIIIYLNNRRSITNRTFFIFSLANVIWSASNYFEYRFTSATATLWALRTHLFLSVWYAFFFFKLAYVFPHDDLPLPAWYRRILLPVVALVSLLTLTPIVFSGLEPLAPPGQVTRAIPSFGIVFFMLVAFGCLLAGLATLYLHTLKEKSVERAKSIVFLIGMSVTAILLLIFNVVLPNVFSNRSFIPLAALFLLPFIFMTFYAIYKHHLFNLKVITTALLGFMVTVFSFVNILFSTQLSGIIVNVTAFTIVLVGSIRIVRDTLSLKNLSDELAETNARQETLIHFIGHEVKGFLTKDAGVFSALVDGDFGALPEVLKPFVTRALLESRSGADSVAQILKASNLKKGTVTYAKTPFDLKALVTGAVEKGKLSAEQKGLTLTFATDAGPYTMVGDGPQIADHVLRNLIDNAINYTPAGTITVSLKNENGRIIFAVKDSGIGITDEDKKRLFTEGGHGKDSQKVNAHSTGYGLYIAKNITEAHGGTIRAESEGEGKGSTFIAEFPVAPATPTQQPATATA